MAKLIKLLLARCGLYNFTQEKLDAQVCTILKSYSEVSRKFIRTEEITVKKKKVVKDAPPKRPGRSNLLSKKELEITSTLLKEVWEPNSFG